MKKFILFDFDGVIADSFKVAREINGMIFPGITDEKYKEGFEMNINEWLKKIALDPTIQNTGVDFFQEYIPRMDEIGVFPDIEKVLRKLAENYTLIVVSSTLSMPISEFAEKHGFADCFTEILGNDVAHSKVEKIKMVFEKYGVGPSDCVFVTDTLGDMIEAEKTGVGAIGVSWGFHTHETLGRGKPFKIVDSLSELEPAIAEYFNTK